MPASDFTDLVLTPVDYERAPLLTPFSCRGVTQSKEFVNGLDSNSAVVERSIYGPLIDLSRPEYRKWRSTITCTDIEAPAFDEGWVGMLVWVDWIHEFSYQTVGGVPSHDAVYGSERTEEDFTFYRPRMLMMVMDYRSGLDEPALDYAWQIDLLED